MSTNISIFGIFMIILFAMAIIAILLINFIPTFIAFKKEHPKKVPILIVNALIPVIGFIIALIWSLSDPDNEHE